MLRKIRIAAAAVFFIGITLLLAGIGGQWTAWMAKLQFLPSCLALNFGVIIGITILTLLFGRIYCSVICPLGVFQDVVIWIRRTLGKRFRANARLNKVFSVKRFAFSLEKKWLRYSVLAVFILALVLGIQGIVLLIAPYSAYGRMVGSVVSPHPWTVVIVAAITFAGLAYLSWTYGRTWCSNVCPVGTVLSLFGRYSLFKPVIDESICVECGKCHRGCKCSCIDGKLREIDYSRCVDCFDCITECKEGAIKYRYAYGRKASSPETGVDAGKRAFLGAALLFGAGTAVKAQEMKVDGGLAALEQKQVPQRSGALVPFGAKSAENFYSHCTACQLCVSACPEKVLRPSSDLARIMQPEMGYEKGYCRPECTLCSELCPSGAILKITPEEKSAIHIGRAVIDLDLCVVNREGVSCGNCSRHCPAGAILMVKKDDSTPNLKIPAVVEDKCIGCGACEYLCPSRPFSAIHVNGLKTHING